MAYSEASKKATYKYRSAAYKRIPLDMKVEEYEAIKKYCEEHGEPSVNGFIKKLIKQAMENT